MEPPNTPNITPTTLFNPDIKDFSWTLANDDGSKTTYVVPAYGIETFPKHAADRIAKQLADHIVFKRGIKDNYELDKSKILKQIYEHSSPTG